PPTNTLSQPDALPSPCARAMRARRSSGPIGVAPLAMLRRLVRSGSAARRTPLAESTGSIAAPAANPRRVNIFIVSRPFVVGATVPAAGGRRNAATPHFGLTARTFSR
ncbi:hypothetical protein, partial [Pseudomonas sp. EA_65y_Pfl1_P113]|uniref:hypothetical protein n=1 Tax=Pseudomonas sp. EA_65y_Pfl1_P113 TaxID=3088692 RepID=UPI0030DB58D4